MSTITLLPKVGMSGLFTAIAPYDQLIHPMVEYTCVTVSSLDAQIAAGFDPLTDVYLANGDTQASYDADRANRESLVTLQAGAGDLIVLPARCLTSLPVTDGVRYVNTYLGLSLAAIAETTDLSELNQVLKEVVYEHLGITPEIHATVVGAPVLVSHDNHARISQARTIQTRNELSLRAKCEVLEQTNVQLQLRLAALESYVAKTLIK